MNYGSAYTAIHLHTTEIFIILIVTVNFINYCH